MNRDAVDKWVERSILALVLGLLLFGIAALGAVRPAEFVVLWWVMIVVLTLWFVRIWTAPRFRFLWPPVCWAVLAFVGYAIWRYRTADIEFPARQELIQIILGALLFLAIVNNLYSQESMRILCFSLVFLAMTVSMYGIYQWLQGSQTVWGLPRPLNYHNRASGTFICPNHLSGFLEMALPLGVAFALGGRTGVVMRILLSYASLVVLVGIAATQSRAGWIATAVSMLFLGVLFLRSKSHRWMVLALLLVIAGAGAWLYSRSVAHRVETTYLTGHERDIRLRLWVAAWEMWKDHPWQGVGPDHFDHRYRAYREAVDKTQGRPGRAHNDYLNTLSDYGSVGLLLALLPIGLGFWSAARCWPHMQRAGNDFGQKQSTRAAVVSGASAGLVSLLVHSFFDFNMHIPANAFVAVTLLAVIVSHIRFATERYWFTARWPIAIAASVALTGTLVYLVPQTLHRTQEAALLRRAEKLEDGSADKIRLLKEAFSVQPNNYETAFAIGEQQRALAWTGADGYEAQAREALTWFERNIALNKWDPVALIRAGMCLHWLGRHDEAAPYFTRAVKLDPNHWYARGMMGWHEFQLEHYPEARDWMIKSLEVNWTDNALARAYLALSDKLIAEGKTSGLPLPR